MDQPIIPGDLGDDVRLVVEAMKMEHPLTAPRDGTIAAIHGEPGSAVEGGAVLIALEPDED